MHHNSSFPSQKLLSTKHVGMLTALYSLVQMNIPLSSVDGNTPSLMSSSFISKYQNFLASASPYMRSCNFYTWYVLAYFEGLAHTVHSIALPCKNAVLTSNEFYVHLFDVVIEQVRWCSSLEHVEGDGGLIWSFVPLQNL